MTDFYEKPKVFQGKLTPYPHEEHGKEHGLAKDPVKFLHAAEQRARERQVAYETVHLLRKRVVECYRKEGVLHYENCQEVAKDYYDIISKKDYGQLQPKWEHPEKRNGW